MNKIDVSVVIVCMNNYGQLKDCLDSIQKYTTKYTYEVLLVAYFFNEENLNRLKSDYPWVKIIISNEIRGFSANNNLALRQAKGDYCFILNDDTTFNTPVLDQLVETVKSNAEISVISPQILRPNGTIQYTGIPHISTIDYLLILYHLKSETYERVPKYVQPIGMFQTYNILGAAFLIKTDIFRDFDFFDERYFFGPEDKALSRRLNRSGYRCYVNADVKLLHIGGATGGSQTRTLCATRPANRKGCAILYGDEKKYKILVVETAIFLNSIIMFCVGVVRYILKRNKSDYYSVIANWNVCKTIFSNISTTNIFKKFYTIK